MKKPAVLARGAIRAYALTGDATYRDDATEMFDFVYQYADSTYGGGIWWKNVDIGNGALNEKNVAINATAVCTAMRIYAATGDVTYRTKAQGLFTWLDSNFYVDGKLRDHIEGAGQFVDWDWTYNQGNYAGRSTIRRHSSSENVHPGHGSSSRGHSRPVLRSYERSDRPIARCAASRIGAFAPP